MEQEVTEETRVPLPEDGAAQKMVIIKSGSANCIENLPEELLVEIFSYLSFEDLIHTVPYVSSHWREVSHVSHLWRNMIYNPKKQDTDSQIKQILKKTPKLQIFIVDERPVHSSVLYTLMENCSDIKKLILCRYQKLSFKILKKLLQKCSNIEHLFIPNKILNEFKLAQVIGQFPKLKSLTGVVLVDPSTSAVLKPIADGCPALQQIDLVSMVFAIRDLEYLLYKKKGKLHTLGVKLFSKESRCTLPLLATCTSLKSLHVDSYGFHNIDPDVEFDSLQNLATVTSLTLQYLDTASINTITRVFDNMAMSQLVELSIMYYVNYEDKLANVIVNNCPRLTRFHLIQCSDQTDESLENFYTLHELQSVYLDSPLITDEGVRHLSKCKDLKYLALVGCEKLTERSMELLTEFRDLRVLNLDYCNIRGLPIHLIPTQLKYLTLLSIRCCLYKDREAVKQLMEQMPRLVISDGMNECDEFNEYTHTIANQSCDISLEDAPFILDTLL